MEYICIVENERIISRVAVGAGLGCAIPVLDEICGAGGGRPLYFFYDVNTVEYAERLAGSCIQAGYAVKGSLGIEVSETVKTLETVQEMTAWLLGQGADRNALIISVGGGLLSDMAGFAAAIYKRGVGCVYFPTTLLAQVDAAIGGKTGVNFDSYKNILGVIRQPEFTFICPEVLDSLDYRDFLSGAAELVKSFIIDDAANYHKAISLLTELKQASGRVDNLDRDSLMNLVAAAAKVKAGIVSRDQFENGERRKLNLGHTFAHAIERSARLSEKDITHGEAVSMGIVMASRLSEAMGFVPSGFTDGMRADFTASGLPVDCPFPIETLAGAMSKDKKAENGCVHFILIKDIGNVTVVDMKVADAVSSLTQF